jgi:aryl-alcohol dehydrogenase-like predicted oxidoreductase
VIGLTLYLTLQLLFLLSSLLLLALAFYDEQTVQQIRKLVQFLLGDYEGAASSNRLRQLIPVAREYSVPLRDYGVLLLGRLTEKNLSRGLRWASEQLLAGGRRRQDRSIIGQSFGTRRGQQI